LESHDKRKPGPPIERKRARVVSRKEEAEAFAANPRNIHNQGDVAVLSMKIGCDGWHLSQPDWPD
jgi:hypothetical protein